MAEPTATDGPVDGGSVGGHAADGDPVGGSPVGGDPAGGDHEMGDPVMGDAATDGPVANDGLRGELASATAPAPAPAPADGETEQAERPSLGRRFLSPRTVLSFAFAAGLIVFALRQQDPETLRQAWAQVRGAHLGWYAAALVTYYLNFPVRGWRWRVLLGNAGEPEERQAPVRDLAEIIYLSWFANAVVPAKLGDVYRGWLLRAHHGTAWSRAMGTIVAERALDLVVLVVLMVTTGFFTYGDVLARGAEGGLGACLTGGWRPEDLGCSLAQLFAVGAVLVVVLMVGLVAFARYGVHVERLLPERIARVYGTFSSALVLSFGRFPRLLGLTLLAWVAEGASFYFVGRALGLELGAALVVFFSLLQAFITVIPLTPGGLGFEPILAAAIGLRGFEAVSAIALTVLYRTISYFSLVVGGLVVFLLSKKTRPTGT